MEANQITCPQCGLENNSLADACVQCGIIFVKSPAMQTAAAAQDEEKRKSIEAAEAMLDGTQPPGAMIASGNETIKRPDPHEDTVEIRIPQESEIPPLVTQSPDSEAPEPVKHTETQNAEIELETIETTMETVTEPTDAETLFLSDVKPDKAAEPADAEISVTPADMPGDDQKAADSSAETEKSVTAMEGSDVSQAADTAVKPFESEPMAATQSQESPITGESEKTPSEPAAPVEAEPAAENSAKPPKSKINSTPKDEAQPTEPEIQVEKESEIAPDKPGAAQTEAQIDAPAATEMPPKKAEKYAQEKQQALKARQEALKKQQEALLQAEARKKEEAARAKAVALKKKKLTQAKAEALKKQKAAQVKAEALKKRKAVQDKALAIKKQMSNQAKLDALKKQKEAQAQAEASAGEMQVAGKGLLPASGDQNNHVKLLGLLKRYKGKAIGINYDNSAEIKEAELVEANEEFFSVMVKDKKVQYSYPLKTILTIVESEQGVETGEDDRKAKFDAVIKVFPLGLF